MCGNFGLLFIKNQSSEHSEKTESDQQVEAKQTKRPRKHKKAGFVAVDGEETLTRNRKVSFDGVGDDEASETEEEDATISAAKDALKNPLLILEAQAANTEIRGGQAGGYSSLEYSKVKNESPAAMHPTNDEVNSPFHSNHSAGAGASHHNTHNRVASTAPTKRSASDTHSPLHASSHDSTVHNQQRPRAMSQSGVVNYAAFEAEFNTVPSNTRVRTVARKRYPLAADLTEQFLKARKGKTIELDKTFTVIAHTRFATSSANKVTELHPHEWTPFKDELVWRFNPIIGRFERSSCVMGVHITHNGDFDELEAYLQVLVNEEVGYWLARILYSHNPAKSDSAKIAGVMELFRVQGRWGPAARLAWVRCVLTSATDVSGGQLLSNDAPHSFPSPAFWTNWAIFLESQWAMHINNIIIPVIAPLGHVQAGKMFFYRIQESGVAQLESAICEILQDTTNPMAQNLGVKRWSDIKLKSFIHHAVRGFLKMDLYNAVTEMIGRAEGSFGLQVHCTLEPGVVIVASKGQPMSIAFDHDTPLVLFASEAEALAVPVRVSGRSLPLRVDLDGHGEVVRVGEPRAMLEGRFRDQAERAAAGTASDTGASASASQNKHKNGLSAGDVGAGRQLGAHCDSPASVHSALSNSSRSDGSASPKATTIVPLSAPQSAPPAPPVPSVAPPPPPTTSAGAGATSTAVSGVAQPSRAHPAGHNNSDQYPNNILRNQQCLYLRCGVEIRSYILNRHAELSAAQLEARCVKIHAPEKPYDPYADLVAGDLADIPAVLNAIDKAWIDRTAPQRIAGHALAVELVACMRRRLTHNQDSIDLLIAGVEASLWLAEQCAADLRRIFPYLNVSTISANKVLGLGDDDSSKVFFPISEGHLERRIDSRTCVLLISQSGQTFSTLHATHKLANIVKDRLWILTGCANSKMESALTDSYRRHNLVYMHDRVIHNQSGHRPAEPTSVAVAAAWHSLTRLIMHLIFTTRALIPSGRMVHEWVYTKSVRIIQTFFRKHSTEMRRVQRLNRCRSMSFDSLSLLVDSNGTTAAGGFVIAPPPVSPVSPVSVKIDTYTRPAVLMRLTDGCIKDLNSLLSANLIPNVCSIVGRDIKGRSLDVNEIQSASAHTSMHVAPAAPTAGSLVVDLFAGSERDNSVHANLVKQGRTWAQHINETWIVLVLAGAYIIISVGFGLPIIGLLGDALVEILRQMGAPLGSGKLIFSVRYPSTIYAQHPGWVICGLLLQLLDALFFVYVGKNIARLYRIITRRPYYARFGKRTIVIVDNPTVHQLLENFVSKLFSQAYSVVSVDVHGASGLDHFVHRFTHRVVRGVLIAVGRVDGRLCCLAKSEASTLLAVKQAAFIRNPEYDGDGSGPDIVTIGHNPFVPNLGLASHVVLNSVTTSTAQDNRPSKISLARLLKLNALRGGEMDRVERAVLKTTNEEWTRHRFLDMYLYNRLYFAEKPFTKSILKSLRYSMEYELETRRLEAQKQLQKEAVRARTQLLLGSSHPAGNPSGYLAGDVSGGNSSKSSTPPPLSPSKSAVKGAVSLAVANMTRKGRALKQNIALSSEVLPYGVHHIDPVILQASSNTESSFATFVMANTNILRKMKNVRNNENSFKNKSSDPAMVLSFSAKLDDLTKRVIDRQVYVQQFYECRIASLERYIAFCVMFHAMAVACHAPWLSVPWNVSRSQSNLRVATTASPISASGGQAHEGPEHSRAVLCKARKTIGTLTTGVQTNF